jgi:predicted nucleic acid-binding protein
MDGYLLDTNVVVLFLRPNHRAAKAVETHLAGVPSGSPVIVSVAALAELHVGPL